MCLLIGTVALQDPCPLIAEAGRDTRPVRSCSFRRGGKQTEILSQRPQPTAVLSSVTVTAADAIAAVGISRDRMSSRIHMSSRYCASVVVACAAWATSIEEAIANAGVGGPSCWTHGITRGQCCNAIFGRGGNAHCWDAGDFTFEYCCNGKVFEPKGCSAFVTHFSFDVARTPRDPRAAADAWANCAASMEDHAARCNSVNTTIKLCPECASLSEHLSKYIRCVKQEQERESVSSNCPACRHNAHERARSGRCSSEDGTCADSLGTGDRLSTESKKSEDGGGSTIIVGGVHFPTLLRPRSSGRDFTLMASAFDMTVGHELMSKGVWMPQEARLLQGLLPVGGVFVDAGANIGGFAVSLAKHVGPDGEVHAFEPFRSLFQMLTANCALNGLLSCFTYHNGLGSRPERRERRMPAMNSVANPSKSFIVDQIANEMLVHYDGRGRTETIEVVRLDDRLNLRRLDVMKIDVESGEYDLLLGAEKTIAQHQPVIYVEDSEEHMKTQGPTRVMRLLSDRHSYGCMDLAADAGMNSMTSLLCAPLARVDEIQRRLHEIDWRLTT